MNFAVFESHPGPMKVEIIAFHTDWFSHGVFHESSLHGMLISYQSAKIISLKSFLL